MNLNSILCPNDCTTDDKIISDLIDRGLPKEKTNEYLLNIDSHIKEKLKDAKTKVTLGIFIVLVLAFFTLLSFANAYANGGKIYILSGGTFFKIY